jgi:hypothetical protein
MIYAARVCICCHIERLIDLGKSDTGCEAQSRLIRPKQHDANAASPSVVAVKVDLFTINHELEKDHS